MMMFRVEGTFAAEDIDHAFAVLASHFAALAAYGLDVESGVVTEITVEPLKDGPNVP